MIPWLPPRPGSVVLSVVVGTTDHPSVQPTLAATALFFLGSSCLWFLFLPPPACRRSPRLWPQPPCLLPSLIFPFRGNFYKHIYLNKSSVGSPSPDLSPSRITNNVLDVSTWCSILPSNSSSKIERIAFLHRPDPPLDLLLLNGTSTNAGC